MEPMQFPENGNLHDEPNGQPTQGKARRYPIGLVPPKHCDKGEGIQYPQSEEDDAGNQEIAESTVHDVYRHLHQPAVWGRDEQDAAGQAAQGLVGEHDEQRNPHPLRLDAFTMCLLAVDSDLCCCHGSTCYVYMKLRR